MGEKRENKNGRGKHVLFVGAKSGRSILPIVPAGLNSCKVYQVATVLLSRQTAGLSGDSVCSRVRCSRLAFETKFGDLFLILLYELP